MPQTIFNTQEIDCILTPEIEPGVPAPVDGDIVWEVLSGNSTIVGLADNGKTATLRSEDGIGSTDFKATGDADLGSGVVPISVIVTLNVIGPQAQTLGVAFGDPRPKT